MEIQAMRFARWVFLAAGIYGIAVIAPMYFLEGAQAAQGRPVSHPELWYGFAGVTLAFQVLFLIVSRDPGRLWPVMVACIIEKVSFPAAVLPLFLMGRTPWTVAGFSAIDLVWAVLFFLAYDRVRKLPT